MILVEKITLPNDLVLEIWDASRSIAIDTTKVELVVKLPIEVNPSYFDKPEQYNKAIEAFGNQVLFEYRNERTFVNNSEKNAVFQNLLESFKKAALHYLSRRSFPQNFVVYRYKDLEKTPYKHRHFLSQVS